MAIQIKLKNSVVQDSTPSTSDLPAVGEIALNANINSIGGFMRASDNSIVKIFGPGSLSTPTATTTVSGISELATNSETTTGTATNRVVTPAGLNAVTVAERSTSNSTYLALAGGTLTGVVAATAGSNSAPSIHFGDSDSGIFGGTNTVSLTAGGTTRLTADTGVSVVGTLAVTGAITSTDDLTIPDKIIHSGDTNTAIRFPAADTVSVETGGSEALRVDSSQRLLVGASSSRASAGIQTRLQIEGTDEPTSSLSLIRNTANTNAPRLIFGKTRGASLGANVVVQDNDALGNIAFVGNDGTDLASFAANIAAFVDGTPGSNDMPGRLVFSTTADGADSPTTRLTIDSAGTSTFTGNITTTGTISSGNINITSVAPIITLTDTNANDDFEIKVNGGLFEINDITNSANRFIIDSSGTVDILGNLDVGAGLDVTGAITATGAITGTAGLSIEGATVFNDAGADVDFRIEGDTEANLFFVDAGQDNIGIATGSPNSNFKLDVNGAARIGNTADGIIIENSSSSAAVSNACRIHRNGSTGQLNLTAGTSTARDMIFNTQTNAGESMRIDSSGRLLLGTTTEGHSSADDLTVNNSGNCGITIRSGSSNDGSIFFSDATSGNGETRGVIKYKHADNALTFNTDGNERMRIDSSGRLLIGGSSSDQSTSMLQVKRANNSIIRVASSDATATNFAAIDFAPANSIAGARIKAVAVGTFASTSVETAYLAFDTRNAGTTAERMRIHSSGLVTVGNDPSGAATYGGQMVIATTSGGVLTCADTGSGERLRLEGGGALGRIGTDSNHPLTFITNGTSNERMRIDTSGRVFIGTTNPAASANADDLCIGNNDGSGETGITLGSNTASGIRFADGGSNSAAAIQYVHGSTNAFTFSSEGSERMRIDSSGNVTIGGNSSVGTKLHIENPSGDSHIRLRGSANYGVLYTRHSDGALTAFTGSGAAVNVGSSNLAISATLSGGNIVFQAGGTSASDERMRIDSSGNVGIGTATIGNESDHKKLIISGASGTGAGILEFQDTSNNTDGAIFSDDGNLFIVADRDNTSSNSSIRFRVDGSSEKMRIRNDGFVGIGITTEVTTGGGSCFKAVDANRKVLMLGCNTSNTRSLAEFHNSNAGVGSISITGSSVSFNTTSDYRLKENEVAISDGITRLKTLKPYRFNFKADASTIVDGFFAHEVTAVPEAITGTKDEVDENNEPIYQSIDQAKLVPLLVAAVQELIGRVEKLEAA